MHTDDDEGLSIPRPTIAKGNSGIWSSHIKSCLANRVVGYQQLGQRRHTRRPRLGVGLQDLDLV